MSDTTRAIEPRPLAEPHRNLLDRLNPVTRLLCLLLLSFPLLLTIDWVSATVTLALTVLVLLCCRFPVWRLLRQLVLLTLLAAVGSVGMVLYGQRGGRVWWHWGPAVVTDLSVRLGVALFLRFFALVLPTLALVYRLDATRTADGLAQVLRLPPRFVLGSLAGFRMLGLFTEDWRTLGQARRARGLGDGGRWRRLVTMSFALLVLAIRRGTRLATAMEAKGFGGPLPRTWARPSRLHRADWLALAVATVVGWAGFTAAALAGTAFGIWS